MSSFTLSRKSATRVVESSAEEVGAAPTSPRLDRARTLPPVTSHRFHPFRLSAARSTITFPSPTTPPMPATGQHPFSHTQTPIQLPPDTQLLLTHPSAVQLPPAPPSSSSSRTIQPRKPQQGRSIEANPLRPHVAAADRIFCWDTPFATRHRLQLSSELPAPLVEGAMLAIHGALAPNTKNTYGAGPLRFTQFCDTWQIAEEDRMPASYALLCAFIGEHKGKQHGNTIRSWMAGIRSWHVVNHAPWYGDDEWVKLARTSANKEGTHHKRPLRAPVSVEHLSALRRVISLSNTFHAAVWAVALCAFFGCRRLGEVVITSNASFDKKYHVLRSAEYATPFVILCCIINLNIVLFSVNYVTVPNRRAFVFPGPKPPGRKEPLSSSPPDPIHSAPSPRSVTTSLSTKMPTHHLPFSHSWSLQEDARTSSSMTS
jgi:hypothetical protein